MYSRHTFARRFKYLIDEKGLTQRAVAELLNTTETTISRYASGDRSPNIETAVELASVLHIDMNTLFGVEATPTERQPQDVTILLSCYEKASAADRQVIWSLLDRYLTPEQRASLASAQQDSTAKIG